MDNGLPGAKAGGVRLAPKIPPSRVLPKMGTNIYLQGTHTAPGNVPELRAAVWKQLRPQQLSPVASP